MWKCEGSRCFPASRSGSGGPGLNAVDMGGAPGPGRRGPDENQRGVGWSRWLMDRIISYTDESGGRQSPRPPRHPTLSSSPQSHAILPPADIHHPVRAWWIVGDHWSEKIPLNGGHSIWRVTANSTHGNCSAHARPPRDPPPPRPPPACPMTPRHRRSHFPLVFSFAPLTLLTFIFDPKFNFLLNLSPLMIICYSFCIRWPINIYT